MSDSIRIADRFYAGGDDFRGFDIAGIGPRDLQYGDALGGKLKAIGTIEETIPTFLPEQYGIKLAAFVDFGTEGLLDKRDKTDPNKNVPIPTVVDDLYLRATAGISVFWKSPMGPLRFDFSRIIRKDYYDRTQLFRFSTTTSFLKRKVSKDMTNRFVLSASAAIAALALASNVSAQAARSAAATPPPVAQGPAIAGMCILSVNQAISTSTVGKYVSDRMSQIVSQVKAELQPEDTAIATDSRALGRQSAPLSIKRHSIRRLKRSRARANALRQKADLRRREVPKRPSRSRLQVSNCPQELDPIARQLYEQHHCSVLVNRDAVMIRQSRNGSLLRPQVTAAQFAHPTNSLSNASTWTQRQRRKALGRRVTGLLTDGAAGRSVLRVRSVRRPRESWRH